ncbi:MlaD family protein [Gordonia phthalatica]|uniref:Mammalian cell entry protein n=1 Tax=Gordonia phthalatica TaxID=1136941 RepID=A0A0N9N9Z7_9ACTN|nr:MCE family protein [Gordonia phthalatica]ALG85126.1 mammalian cell entry protein [Gordonia phthalatica]
MRIDTGGRDPSLKAYFIRGVIFLAVAAVVFALLIARYEGKFDSRTEVTADLTDIGDGLVSGADVRFNGFIVGSVGSIDLTGSGDNPTKSVELVLDKTQAEGIPANTTARTVPSNLFGVNAVELIAPGNPSSDRLASGDVVPADTSEPTIRLQDAQNELRTLLRSVPPEDLGMVLGTIADALQGGGATFSTFVGVLDTYWKTINAQFPPGAPSGFDNFNRAVRGLAQSTPDLLDALGKSVVPAMTVAQNSEQLTALLSAGQGMLDQTQTLFAKNGDGGKRIVRDLNTMLGAVMLDPDAMPQALHEIYVLAGRVLGVFTGTNGHVQLNLGINFSAYQQYSRQNCPVYDGGPYGQLRGPGCVGPGTGTGPTMSGPLSIYPPSMQRRTVKKRVSGVTTAKDGTTLKKALGRKPTAADTLMLGPLVAGVTPKGGDK